MKKVKRKNVGLLIGISFAVLMVIIIIYFIFTYFNNQTHMKDRMNEVEGLYKTFKEHVDSFNKKRDEVYQATMQEMYYQKLAESDDSFKLLYKEYEKVIEELDKDYHQLKGKCVNVLYPDVSINNKCEAFILGYEEIINTYVNDVNRYNQKIVQYNMWLQQTNSSEKQLEQLDSKKDYIDVNGDHIFRGKEQIEDIIGEVKDEKEER